MGADRRRKVFFSSIKLSFWRQVGDFFWSSKREMLRTHCRFYCSLFLSTVPPPNSNKDRSAKHEPTTLTFVTTSMTFKIRVQRPDDSWLPASMINKLLEVRLFFIELSDLGNLADAHNVNKLFGRQYLPTLWLFEVAGLQRSRFPVIWSDFVNSSSAWWMQNKRGNRFQPFKIVVD